MSDNLESAKTNFNRADKLLKIALIILASYAVILLTFVTAESLITQNTIAKNQKINSQASNDRFVKYEAENSRQQLITQQYVQCVATTLVIPIDQRDPNQFNNCSKTAQEQNKAGKPSTSPTP